MNRVQTAKQIDTISFAYDKDNPISLPDRFNAYIGQPLPPQILPQNDSPPVDLSLGDIRWQVAVEWLEIARSKHTAYRKPPSFFRMVPSLTPTTSPFPKMWVPAAPQGPTSRHVLPRGEYDRRYRQEPSDVAYCQNNYSGPYYKRLRIVV